MVPGKIFQEPGNIGSCQYYRQSSFSLGADRVAYAPGFPVEDIPVEKEKCIECLLLGGLCDISLDGKVGEEIH